MSDARFVEVFARPEDMQDTAVALLAAAKDHPEVVATVSGGFRVPADVADAAGYGTGTDGSVDAAKAESDTAGDQPVLAADDDRDAPADANPTATFAEAQARTAEMRGEDSPQAKVKAAAPAAKRTAK